MKTKKLQLDTPTLDEYSIHTGIPVGINPEKPEMFCYAFKHWHFAQALDEKHLSIWKEIVNNALEMKLEQLLDDSEIFKLEDGWMSKLSHEYHILVVKNLQRAMNSDEWFRDAYAFR